MSKENTVFLLIFILVTSLSWAGIAFYKTTQGGETTTSLPSIVYKSYDCVIYSYTSDITETLINRVQEAVITHHLKLITIMIEERNFSLSLVRQDGSLYNKLVSSSSNKSQKNLLNSVSGEIDNAFY